MTDDFNPAKVAWVWDMAGFERLIVALEANREVYFDLETTGLNEWAPTAKIVMASFTLENLDTWVLPLYHPESPFIGSWRTLARRALGVLAQEGKFVEAHNGKFDCRWTTKHTGVDVHVNLAWDSRISSHSLDENFTSRLKDRAMRTFDIDNWADFDLSKEGAALAVPIIDLGLYAARDTYWGKRLSLHHRDQMFTLDPDERPEDADEVEDARLGRVMQYVAMPTVRTMTAVENRGMALDREWVSEHIETDQAIKDETTVWLAEKYDMPVADASFAATSHWFLEWTRRAVEAGDLRVAALTKGGKPQWNKSIIAKQARAGSEVAEQLLHNRASTKRLEYLRSWMHFCREDGAVHANYNVGSLVTGRLSSSEPNMQQVTASLKPAFVPRPGYVVADFDYSQIELRVAAFFADCIPMKEAFIAGKDLHKMIAADIVKKTLDRVTPDERQGGKAANFGFLFGQSAYGFKFYAEDQYGVVLDDRGAQAMYDAFFNTWTGMAEWHARTISKAHRTGQVESPIGRVRRLPGIFSSNDGAVRHAENAALNAPVQGFASDLMQTSAALIEGTLPGFCDPVPQARLVATVHDSIVAELPEDNWEAIAHDCVIRMERHVLDVFRRMDVDFDVPIKAEVKVGTRWGLKDVGVIE